MADLTHFEYFLCDCFGEICNVVVGHPFDTVKVRLQISTGDEYSGTFNCIRKTVRDEGFGTLYNGIQPPVIIAVPVFGLSCLGYIIGAQFFDTSYPDTTLFTSVGTGVFCGILTTIIVAPGERIKCLLQVQKGGEGKYSGMVNSAIQLYREGGISNLYRGTIATLLRDIPMHVLHFFAYKNVRHYVSATRSERYKLIWPTMFAVVMAGVVNMIVGMPPDVIKSRVQTTDKDSGGTGKIFMELIRNEGPFALYNGTSSVIWKAIPSQAAYYAGFNFLAYIIRKNKDQT